MLMGGDELVSDEVVHHDVSDDAFHYLAWHRSEGYGSIVGWVSSGAFLEDGGNVRFLPVGGEFPVFKGLTEYSGESFGKGVGTFT
jgi:hypothetical protein